MRYTIMNQIAGALENFDTLEEAKEHLILRTDDAIEFEREFKSKLSEDEIRALYWIKDNQPEKAERERAREQQMEMKDLLHPAWAERRERELESFHDFMRRKGLINLNGLKRSN